MYFIRKGMVGDWSSDMTDEQNQRLDNITRDMVGLGDFWHPQSNAKKEEK